MPNETKEWIEKLKKRFGMKPNSNDIDVVK